MKTIILALSLLIAVSVRAQLPTASLTDAGFDPARLEVLHATMKRFVDEGQHAGLITLLARDGKIVDFQTYGLSGSEVANGPIDTRLHLEDGERSGQ